MFRLLIRLMCARSGFGSVALGVLLACCGQSHPPPLPCDPAMDGGGACPPGQVCRETWDGDHVCMETCGESGPLVCASGAACARRAPGPELVCWPGGNREHGEACSHGVQCAFGLACNRIRICEEACGTYGAECTTPGYRCIHSVCQPPIPRDTPCVSPSDCDPFYLCGPDTLFTCQPTCPPGGVCYDGTPCNELDHTVTCGDDEPPRFDSCERAADGTAVGCAEGQACVLTAVGVRRCVRAGCRPDEHDARCGGNACLPDPEDPDTLVCWPGGSVRGGQPCSDSYECSRGMACNSAGRCASTCAVEGEPCSAVTMPGHVCRDHVCTPEA